MSDMASQRNTSGSPDATFVSETTQMSGRDEIVGHHAFESLIARAKALPPMPTAVIWPCESHALAGPVSAAQNGIIKPLLVGDRSRIREIAAKEKIDLTGFEFIDVATPEDAAATGVKLVTSGRARGLMKGSLETEVLMHAVVGVDAGLRTSRRISHVFLIAASNYENIIFVTDGAITIFPSLDDKRDIIQNAIDLHIGLGLGNPRVAILSAVETINSKIPSTVDAAALCKMSERGQITGGILDGPLALDNAISAESARTKKIVSSVAGRAQILVAPDLVSGNMLSKSIIFIDGAESAGIVLGAKVPVILTSRADSVQARFMSTVIGSLYGHYLAEKTVTKCFTSTP